MSKYFHGTKKTEEVSVGLGLCVGSFIMKVFSGFHGGGRTSITGANGPRYTKCDQ
jgi:hypothetical protein